MSQEDSAVRVRQAVQDCGVSLSEWARLNGFSTALVYQVLAGKRKCLRGQSHRIAVALGLKSGQALEAGDFSRFLKGVVSQPQKEEETV